MSRAWLASVLLGSSLGCGVQSEAGLSARPAREIASKTAAPPPPMEFVVSVLGINDLHGKLGALPAFAGYVNTLRRVRGASGKVLAVDAGDMFQGTLASNSVEGRSVIAAYNALGLSAATLGNHEFDYGPLDGASSGQAASAQGALRTRLEEARFPVLSANLLELASNAPPVWNNLAPSVLIDAGEVRIGIVGVLTAETPSIVMPDYFAGLAVAPLAPAVTKEARELRARGADAVLVLAHAGADCKHYEDPNDVESCDADSSEVFALARAVPRGLVDGIVAGHTHAATAHFVNGVAVVQAFSRGRAFSRLDLCFGAAPRRLLSIKPFSPEPLCPETAELAPCSTHPYAGEPVRPDPVIAALIAPDLERARAARARTLGVEVLDEMPADSDSECALGNAFVDAMRAAVAGADVAISNGGGLRAKLDKGPLSYGRLYEAMPFDNRLVKITLTAAEFSRVLAQHLQNDAHGLVSLSGLRVKARCSNGKLEVELFREDGAAVNGEASLSVITSDYLATGGDRLFTPLALERSRIEPLDGALVRDALASQLEKRRRLDPKDHKLFDTARPRLDLPSARPIRCDR